MKKRILSLCMVAALLFGMLPNIALCVRAETIASGTSKEGFYWELDNEGTLMISGTGPMKDYYPAGDGPTSWVNANLGTDYKGPYNEQVKRVVLSQGITKIGKSAFHFCKAITSIEIPDSVTSIEQYAFSMCTNLQDITIPNGVTTIDSLAFDGSGLTSIIFPESISSIGFSAFSRCENLEYITFVGNAPTIGDEYMDVFEDVNATVYYPRNNPTWTADVMQNYGGILTWVPMDSLGNTNLVEESPSLFIPVVESRIVECKFDSLSAEKQQECRGILYDLDSDGNNELILRYVDKWNDLIFEVWNIQAGSPCCINTFNVFSGGIGTNGSLSLSTQEGQPYLVYQWLNSGMDYVNDLSEIFCLVDGKYERTSLVSISDLGKLTPIMRSNYGIDENETPEGMVLPDLIAYLQPPYENSPGVDESESSDSDFVGNFNEFMEQEAYQPYWISSVSEHTPPTQYSFIDINKDGNQELIICSDNDFGFYLFSVFEYHRDTNKVTPLPIPAPGYEIHSCYGGLEYSDLYAAIVFTETNNGSAFGGLTYYSMNEGELSSCFHIGYENYAGNGAKYYTSEEENISEEKYFEYIFESVAIEFAPIVDFVPVENLANPYEDYARAEWIKQHMEYAASDEYRSDIVSGFSNRMLAVFRDALDDEGIQSYNTRKALSAFLSIDVEFDDADMYELIIAQVLYGKESRDLAEQAFEVNYQKAMADIAKSLVNVANSGDSVKELPQDVRDSINELYKLLQTLECGSDEYGKTLKTIFGQIKANANEKILRKWKTELLGDVAFTGLGIVIDGAFEQYNALEDIAIYISNYMAYQNTSQQTREVLARLAVNVLYKYDGWYGVGELIDELGLWGSIKNWPAFQTALISVADAMEAYEQEGAAAIAKYAVEREKEALDKFASKTVKTITIFAVEKALSCVPVINTILIAKNVVNTALIATITLDQIFTNVDDREYALDILTKTYCISVMLDKTVEDCKEGMSEDDFYSTTVFDEAVSTYKRNLLLASGYAVKYADMVLANAEAELEEYNEDTDDGKKESIVDRIFEFRDKLIQAVTWYTNSLAILKEQQVEIESIACHDADLYYNQLTDEIIYNFEDSRIYIVACPVDVIVTDESGEQIAYLSGEKNEILDGYEFYFHTIKIPDNSGEYIKVAIVPNHYRIEIKGTADGVMHAFVTDFTTNDVGEVETYFNILITKDSEGYFEAASDGSNESSLVVDQMVYSNMETTEDIPTNSRNNTTWLWIICGVAVIGVTALIIITKRKKSNA